MGSLAGGYHRFDSIPVSPGKCWCAEFKKNPPFALMLGSCLQNLCFNAATPFHKADAKNLKSDKRVKNCLWTFVQMSSCQ